MVSALGGLFKLKLFVHSKVMKMFVLLCFFSKSFIVLPFTFGYTMFLELVFIYGVRWQSRFIFFCVEPTLLLKITILSL